MIQLPEACPATAPAQLSCDTLCLQAWESRAWDDEASEGDGAMAMMVMMMMRMKMRIMMMMLFLVMLMMMMLMTMMTTR
eukprot:6464318-Pyramimonas_sp.AAC.1